MGQTGINGQEAHTHTGHWHTLRDFQCTEHIQNTVLIEVEEKYVVIYPPAQFYSMPPCI